MSDEENKPRLAFLEEDTGADDKVSNFNILIFQANPLKRNIKIWFPLEEFSTYMNKQRFINVICEIMGEDFRARLEYCNREYGGMYLIDRIKKEIRSISPSGEEINRSPKVMLDDYLDQNPELKEDKYSSFHEVNINNVFSKFSQGNFFK